MDGDDIKYKVDTSQLDLRCTENNDKIKGGFCYLVISLMMT